MATANLSIRVFVLSLAVTAHWNYCEGLAQEKLKSIQEEPMEVAKNVAKWIEQLGSSEFRTRIVAERELVRLKKAAVIPLENAAAGDDLERSSRCLHALVQIVYGDDEDAETAALKAIERLSNKAELKIAEQAAERFAILTRTQQKRTIARWEAAKTKGLTADETKALAALTRFDSRRRRIMVSRVKKYGDYLNLHFQESPRESDVAYMQQLERKLGTLFFTEHGLLTDEKLKILKGVPARGLAIWDSGVNDVGLKSLIHLPKLESLSLRNTQVTDKGLKIIKALPHLTKLTIEYASITDAGLKHVGEMKQITSVHFYRCQEISDDGLRNLSSLVNVNRMFLNNNDRLTSGCLVHLSGFDKLVRLELDGLRITNHEHLKQISALTGLTRLSLSSTNLADDDVEFFRNLKALNILVLSKTNLTDACLKTLSQMGTLQQISLSSTKISDNGLAHLNSMTDLTSLGLSNLEIGDAGMEHLKGLINLTSLSLSNTRVTDVGIEKLKGLQNLENLDLSNTKVTREGTKSLQAALPKCRIRNRFANN